MSRIEAGAAVTAAPIPDDFAVALGTVERCGPIAFLWRGMDTGRLLYYAEEGETWARTEDLEAVAALQAYRKLALSVQP